YSENQWSPKNDIFSAFLVLYELLTGTHPFGGGSPDPNQRATIQREEFPDSFAPDVVERVAEVFGRALSPVASERPKTTKAAIKDLELVLRPAEEREGNDGDRRQKESLPPPPLPSNLELGSPLTDLVLSTRAQGALARLGLTVVADLVG